MNLLDVKGYIKCKKDTGYYQDFVFCGQWISIEELTENQFNYIVDNLAIVTNEFLSFEKIQALKTFCFLHTETGRWIISEKNINTHETNEIVMEELFVAEEDIPNGALILG